MTSLLATAAWFLILSQWLPQWVMAGLSGRSNSCKLDMAYNAFDDQYKGCTELMDKKAPQLLEKELEVNKEFKEEWEGAQRRWKEIKLHADPSKQLSDFEGTALVAYTGKIATDFNKAVREFRQYPKNFQFKAFHYYLTRALQLLKTNDCRTVYRGIKIKCQYNEGKVRFGQFASSSTDINVAKGYIENGKGTLFTIRTCLGVPIKAFAFQPSENEVLIPGYEVFERVSVNKINETYEEVSLDNPQKNASNYNCTYSSGMKESPAFGLLLLSLLGLLLLPAEL
ncbi:T-cell ecto-ADP-ribosyltransferase 2-like [Phyllostomus discolor]|uniref:NAD(P)(+)--arginine ADP-ribosyltransferase n=1 Tax=Phyllostomus discolor TaxID=89673 RepID=A0A6J2LT83_9CHIR|nr:T-cell ecto-ADP-ribosyltransferase 2-like [Phyllostomus discolor]